MILVLVLAQSLGNPIAALDNAICRLFLDAVLALEFLEALSQIADGISRHTGGLANLSLSARGQHRASRRQQARGGSNQDQSRQATGDGRALDLALGSEVGKVAPFVGLWL